MLPFYLALGFRQTFRQTRPNPYLCLSRGDGFDLHFFGLPEFDPENSLGNVIVTVTDTGILYDEFAAGLRSAYGKLPLAGIPRITRPRRKQGTATGFSVVDPGGNWLRITAGPEDEGAGSRLERARAVLKDIEGLDTSTLADELADELAELKRQLTD